MAARLGISKPDVTAPGIQILVGQTPEPVDPADPPGQLFQAIAGTSVSSPHIAGSGALLKALNPTWTPGQIKSALMTTASTKTLLEEDGVTPFTPFDAGSGRVDLTEAPTPGLTFDVSADDYVNHAEDLWTVNYPSIYLPDTAPNSVTIQRTALSQLAQDSQWQLTVHPASGLGITVPPSIMVPAGGPATFSIGLDKSAIPPGQVRHAALQLTFKGFLLHLPITAAGAVNRPDLVVTSLSGPARATRGAPVSISAHVKNKGAVAAGAFTIAFYLSEDDAVLSPDDVFFASCDVDSLAVNASLTCSGRIEIPMSIPAGTYFLIVRADDGQAVFESDETNDVRTKGPITLK